MSQSRRKLEQINKYIADKHNALIGLNDFLQKNLSIAENRVKSSQINNNKIILKNNNARMLAETLQKEKEVWKYSSSKMEELKDKNLLLQKAFSEERNTVERYKIQIQDLEKEKR